MATIRPSTSPTNDKERHQLFPILTSSDMLLPNRDSASTSYRVSGSSFLSSDTEASTPSSIGVSSPLSSDSLEFGNAATFLIPARPKPAPPLSSSRLYPSYGHSGPLSDIGEEDSPRARRLRSKTPSPIASSPTIAPQSAGHSPPRSPDHGAFGPDNRLSMLSNSSNISTGSDQHWESFDAMPGMSDRLKADLAAMGDDGFDFDGSGGKRSSVITIGDEEHMTQALSSKAEQILANAKKRLTHMEGNLSRARGSLLVSPRQSPTLSEQREVGGLYKSISQGGDRRLQSQGPNPRKTRSFRSHTNGLDPIHTKNLSETSVPSHSPRYGKPVEARSASAMEYGSGRISIDAMLHDRSSRTFTTEPTHPLHPSQTSPLPGLGENEATSSTDMLSDDAGGSPYAGTKDYSKYLRIGSRGSAPGLTRSQSQITPREFRDYVEEFKDQEDRDDIQRAQPARRNSVQDLPAHSSFAGAKDWYARAAEYYGGESPLSTNAGMGWKYKGDQHEQSNYTPTSPISPNVLESTRSLNFPNPPTSPTLPQSTNPALESPVDNSRGGLTRTSYFNLGREQPPHRASSSPSSFLRSINGERDDQSSYLHESHHEDACGGKSDPVDEAIAASEEEQIFLNEVLEESLQDTEPQAPPIPDDALQNSGGPERHEDRADAFDYENFFLHSALGNYSQGGFHERGSSPIEAGSRLSYDSNASMETTRAPQNNEVEFAEQDNDEAYEKGSEGREQGTFLDDEPPTPTGQKPAMSPHFRSSSVASSSSATTFATATEGGSSSSSGGGNDTIDDDEAVPEEILNWGESSIIGGWPSPPAHLSRAGVTQEVTDGLHSPETSYMSPAEMFPPPPQTKIANSRSVSPLLSSSSSQISPRMLPPRTSSTAHPAHHGNTNQDTNPSSGSDIEPDTSSEHRLPNTEILISALITLANPDFQASSAPFTDLDQDLVVNLLRSVGAVCEGICQVTGVGSGAGAGSGAGSETGYRGDGDGDGDGAMEGKDGGGHDGGNGSPGRSVVDRKRWGKVLRRRLEIARQVLEGEMEGEGEGEGEEGEYWGGYSR